MQDSEDLDELSSFLQELKGYGGDEQWHGSWYPAILIRDSYFTAYCEELVRDVEDLRNVSSYVVIDWDATADNMKGDYSEVDVGGITYWYR